MLEHLCIQLASTVACARIVLQTAAAFVSAPCKPAPAALLLTLPQACRTAGNPATVHLSCDILTHVSQCLQCACLLAWVPVTGLHACFQAGPACLSGITVISELSRVLLRSMDGLALTGLLCPLTPIKQHSGMQVILHCKHPLRLHLNLLKPSLATAHQKQTPWLTAEATPAMKHAANMPVTAYVHLKGLG